MGTLQLEIKAHIFISRFFKFIRWFTVMSIATTKSTVAESELYTDRTWFIITVRSITKFAKNS